MKTKDYFFKRDKKDFKVTIPVFESLKEAVQLVGEDEVFRVYLWGQLEVAKLMEIGKSPFKPKRKRLIIKTHELNQVQIKELKRLGILKED